MTDTPTRFGEHYELLQHVASGGMADIWLAERVGAAGFRKRVCIKRIKRELTEDDEYVTMFLDEARIISRLSHPHIVEVYELGQVDDEWFVAMEWVEGRDLDAVIAERRSAGETVAPAVACRILCEVLAGLSHAHGVTDVDGSQLELVHRDVSPANVLLSVSGIAKLTDFGVASATGRQTKTQTGAVKGKLAYMAPEQIGARELDARTDVFAVGIVAYELLTGVHPFGDGLSAVHHIVEKDPPPIETEVPAPLVEVVLRALEKDPAERWPSAAAMKEALETVARSEGWHATARDVSFLAGPPSEDTVKEPPVEFPVPTLDFPVPTQDLEGVAPTDDFPIEEPIPTREFPAGEPVPTKDFPADKVRRGLAETREEPDKDMLVLVAGVVVFLVLLAVVFGLLAARDDGRVPRSATENVVETPEEFEGSSDDPTTANEGSPKPALQATTGEDAPVDPAEAERAADRARREAEELKRAAEEAKKAAEDARREQEKAEKELRKEAKKNRGKGKDRQKGKKGKGKDD